MVMFTLQIRIRKCGNNFNTVVIEHELGMAAMRILINVNFLYTLKD